MLVLVYKNKKKQKIHTVDLPAWENAGWSTEPIDEQSTINKESKSGSSRSRRKSVENAVGNAMENQTKRNIE